MTKTELADLAEQAARLAKADLVTEMVGEFPELQGLMGGYYARAEGLPDAVANAIRDHYKPVGQGDEVPAAPVTVAVSLADKLDTLVGFFQIDEKPTGSKDPFALRRAALGILRLLLENDLRASMFDLITNAAHAGKSPNAGRDIASFLIERLKVQQRDANIQHDMIDAVVAVEEGGDNVRMVKRTQALQSFMETEEGANLLAGYKRAANILKKEVYDVTPAQAGVQGGEGASGQLDSRLRGSDNTADDLEPHTGEEDPLALVDDPDMAGIVGAPTDSHDEKTLSYTPEPAEKALIEALDTAAPRAREAVAQERFGDAMGALASLRAPIDAFFDSVTVNDPDEAKRAARLALLARFRDAVHAVADFGRIEG